MALTKTVNIDGKDVTFRASAAIPRIYRNKFHRDIYKDLHDLQKSIDENDPENSALDSFSLELFEDISYIMAKHADPQGVPDTPDEWLDQFGTFSIYQVLPEIIELWNASFVAEVCAAGHPYQRIGSADDWNRAGYVHRASEGRRATRSVGKSG